MRSTFDALDKPAQTARIEALARAALPRWGLAPDASLRLLSDGYNTVFRADTELGPLVVRVHRPDLRSAHGLEVEWRWLEALAAEGFAAPSILWTHTGEPHAEVAHPEVPEPRHVTLFSWRDGTLLADLADPDTLLTRLEEQGALMAHLHAHTATFRDVDALAPRLAAGTWSGTWRASPERLPPSLTPLLARATARVDALFASATGRLQLCHADLHPGNLLITDDGLAPIDFDDCALTSPAYDLGIVAFYLSVAPLPESSATPPDEAAVTARLAALERGYRRHRPWPMTPDALRTLILARQVALLNLFSQETGATERAAFDAYCAKVEARLDAWLRR